MVQTINADLEIEIVIKCYDDGLTDNKHYMGYIKDYNGMKVSCCVQSDTASNCVTEIGKSLEALEAYRKHQKKAS